MDSIVRIRAGMGDGTGTKAGFIGKIPRETPFFMLKNMLPMMPPVAA